MFSFLLNEKLTETMMIKLRGAWINFELGIQFDKILFLQLPVDQMVQLSQQKAAALSNKSFVHRRHKATNGILFAQRDKPFHLVQRIAYGAFHNLKILILVHDVFAFHFIGIPVKIKGFVM